MVKGITATSITEGTDLQMASVVPAQQQRHTDWSAVVARIQDGDRSAEVELYGVFSRGIRYFLLRQLGQDELEDNVHDCFVVCIEAVRCGRVREPERLMGFVRTVVKRKIQERIGGRIRNRSRFCSLDQPLMEHLTKGGATPEYLALAGERRDQVQAVVARLPEREREVLRRFYLLEQPKEQICEEMKLSETQFRLIKSRTKSKLTKRAEGLRQAA